MASPAAGEELRQILGEILAMLDPDAAVDFVAHFITPWLGCRVVRRFMDAR